MMRIFMLFATYAAMSIYFPEARADAQSVPQCLAGFCLNAGNLPTEKAVRARFGGAKKTVQWKSFAYCYQFTGSDQQISYGRFLFKNNFGIGWRLVTIRLSNRPVCADAYAVQLKVPPSTRERIQLNSEEAKVLMTYGQPRYSLRPPPAEVVRDFLGDSPEMMVDVIDQYVSDDDRDLLTARFYIARGRVVGIEISVDE